MRPTPNLHSRSAPGPFAASLRRCVAASLPFSFHVTLASLSILHGISSRSLDIASRYTCPGPRPALTYHDKTLPPPTTLARSSPTNHLLLLQFALALFHTRPRPLCLDRLPVRPARCHQYPASSSNQRIHCTPRSPQFTAYRGPPPGHCLLSATPQKPWSAIWARPRARGGHNLAHAALSAVPGQRQSPRHCTPSWRPLCGSQDPQTVTFWWDIQEYQRHWYDSYTCFWGWVLRTILSAGRRRALTLPYLVNAYMYANSYIAAN
jgi:hypothetical protein